MIGVIDPEKRPKYSVLHTSARPHAWRETYNAWMAACACPEHVEYILCIDERWGFNPKDFMPKDWSTNGSCLVTVVNKGRKCMVDGYAEAARHARGAILILNSDDMRPTQGWDTALELASNDRDGAVEDFVIQVSSGTAADARDLMVCQILSHRRYARLGYAMFPGYLGMYADDDFSEHARHDGVVIDAKYLTFPHLHSAQEQWDEVYRHQNAPASYEFGAQLLAVRRATGFGSGVPTARKQRTIAVCVPGDHFSGVWLGNFVNLFAELVSAGYSVHCFLNYSSNVYITRRCILEGLKRMSFTPDYVLWIDDDNTPNWGHISGMISDLDTYPQVGMVTGWCWIQPDGYEIRPLTSCGYFGEGLTGQHLTQTAMDNINGLGLIDWSGFPTILMRGQVIADVPVTAFDPRPAPGNRWGFTGEDVAFCITAKEYGHDLYVDSRMEIPHYKLRPARPNMAGALKAEEIGEVV